jgi:hypothetical protein
MSTSSDILRLEISLYRDVVSCLFVGESEYTNENEFLCNISLQDRTTLVKDYFLACYLMNASLQALVSFRDLGLLPQDFRARLGLALERKTTMEMLNYETIPKSIL